MKNDKNVFRLTWNKPRMRATGTIVPISQTL